MEKQFGKIRNVNLGSGGYQDAMFGVSFDLGGESWGVGDFWGFWGSEIKSGENSKWTESQRETQRNTVLVRLEKLMQDAKVTNMSKLKGIPVEVSFDKNCLKEWRILKEVL